MEEPEFRELLEKCLDGGATPDEEQRVVEAARRSPALRDQLLKAAGFDASLRSLGHDPESFTRRAIETLGHGETKESFARDVRRRLERERKTRRFGAGGASPLAWAAAAVLVVAGAALLVSIGRREPSGPREAYVPPPRPQPAVPPVVPPPPPPIEEPPAPKKEPDQPVPPAPLPPPPAPVPAPSPAPPKPSVPERTAPETNPPPAPTLPRETRTAIAKVERVEGEAFLLTEKGRTPIQAGQDVLPGQGVETSESDGRVVLTFADKTRLELARDTRVQEIHEAPAKLLSLIRGELVAVVTRQPAGRAMTIAAPHAEATVLGTTLRLVVQPGDKGSTRLEVLEGKVRLTRLADKKGVEVVTGHFAVVVPGVTLVPRPLAPMTQGLVAYWTFDEAAGAGAQDESGYSNHGALTQAPRRVAGKSGQALQFDGARQYVRVPHSGRLSPEKSAWTVTAWVRTTESAMAPILFKDNGNFTQYYYLAAGAQAVFDVGDGASSTKVQGTRAVADGRWHHVVGVRTAERTVQLYVDGTLDATATAPRASGAVKTTSDVTIGYTPASLQANYWRGLLDEIRLYDRALSADEVKTLFELGR